jgi:DNA-binding NtrC family response regulator
MRSRILVVEDNDDVRDLFDFFLNGRYDAVTVRDGVEAREHLAKDPFDLVICDYVLPGDDGRRVAEFAEEHGVPAILITGDPKSMDLIRDLPFAQLTKPFQMDELERLVDRVLLARAAVNSIVVSATDRPPPLHVIPRARHRHGEAP